MTRQAVVKSGGIVDIIDNGVAEQILLDGGEMNVELFKALAAMNDENDREQWFIAEEAKAWVNQGLYAPIGSFEKCLLEHRVGIPARKATVEEIIEHFKKREK